MAGIRITDRDRQIVRDVWLFRYVNTKQIARLHFSSIKLVQRRMRVLSEAGLVDRFEVGENSRRGFQTWWYRLARSGAELVAQAEGFEPGDPLPPKRQPKAPRFLRHHSEVTDFRIWLREGVLASEGRFSCSFVPEYEELPAKRRSRIALDLGNGRHLVPDGVFVLKRSDGKAALFTLEIDRGTEPLTGRHPNAIARKLSQYRIAFDRRADEYYGQLFGHKFRGFRVLCVVPDEERRNGFLRLAKEADLAPLIWAANRELTGRHGDLDETRWFAGKSRGLRALTA